MVQNSAAMPNARRCRRRVPDPGGQEVGLLLSGSDGNASREQEDADERDDRRPPGCRSRGPGRRTAGRRAGRCSDRASRLVRADRHRSAVGAVAAVAGPVLVIGAARPVDAVVASGEPLPAAAVGRGHGTSVTLSRSRQLIALMAVVDLGADLVGQRRVADLGQRGLAVGARRSRSGSSSPARSCRPAGPCCRRSRRSPGRSGRPRRPWWRSRASGARSLPVPAGFAAASALPADSAVSSTGAGAVVDLGDAQLVVAGVATTRRR